MRPTDAHQQERLLALFQRHVDAGRAAGLIGLRVEDQELDPAYMTVKGRRISNFGLCSYLGLSTDARLKRGAIEATERFGPVYSSSATYSAVELYTELEEKLRQIFGAAVVLAPTTTLGHLAALPTMIAEGDVLLVDKNAHASVHLATRVVASEGIPVVPVKHNDVEDLVSQLDGLEGQYRHAWFLADGVYSMSGGVAPVSQIVALLDRYPGLHLYLDDAHGFGWKGQHGRGWVLNEVDWHPRMVVAVGFAKSWSSGGAALAFGDPKLASKVRSVGGTLTFSGPIHPPQLGAAIAAADIHLSKGYEELQARFLHQIEFVSQALLAAGVPALSFEPTPLWIIPTGNALAAKELASRLMARGYFTNFAAFPAVPIHQSGIRFMNTLAHSDEQIDGLVDTLAELLPEVVGETSIDIDLDALQAERTS